MKGVTIRIQVTDDDFQAGWNSNYAELADSVRATLGELIGDDGNAYVPHVAVMGGGDGITDPVYVNA